MTRAVPVCLLALASDAPAQDVVDLAASLIGREGCTNSGSSSAAWAAKRNRSTLCVELGRSLGRAAGDAKPRIRADGRWPSHRAHRAREPEGSLASPTLTGRVLCPSNEAGNRRAPKSERAHERRGADAQVHDYWLIRQLAPDIAKIKMRASATSGSGWRRSYSG